MSSACGDEIRSFSCLNSQAKSVMACVQEAEVDAIFALQCSFYQGETRIEGEKLAAEWRVHKVL